MVYMLLWFDEICDFDFLVLDQKVEIKFVEFKMVGQVVDLMVDDFNLDCYYDIYQEQLQELIDIKFEGGQVFIVED